MQLLHVTRYCIIMQITIFLPSSEDFKRNGDVSMKSMCNRSKKVIYNFKPLQIIFSVL